MGLGSPIKEDNKAMGKFSKGTLFNSNRQRSKLGLLLLLGVTGVVRASGAGDVDGDGLPDSWELEKFQTLAFTGSGDPDGDGLDNQTEHLKQTDPLDRDTDSDGLADGLEVAAAHRSSPLKADTDGDGLCDGSQAVFGAESCIAGEDLNGNGIWDHPQNSSLDGATITTPFETDPRNPDTDQGGVGDGDEKKGGTDPVLDGTDDDRDRDGLSDDIEDGVVGDLVEVCQAMSGALPGVCETVFFKPDTDGDGVCDGPKTVTKTNDDGLTETVCVGGEIEILTVAPLVFVVKSFPNADDSDADGLCDGPTGDGCLGGDDAESALGSDPLVKDSDGDGFGDLAEVLIGRKCACLSPTKRDSDDDGVDDNQEFSLGAPVLEVPAGGTCLEALRNLGATLSGDPCNEDSDEDGFLDILELGVGSLALDDASKPADTDGDRLPDVFETAWPSLSQEVLGGSINIATVFSTGSFIQASLNSDEGDTDTDGISDFDEIMRGEFTDPLNPDTDGDGLCDGGGSSDGCAGGEDTNNDGLFSQGSETSALKIDTDGDGLCDGSKPSVGEAPLQFRGVSCGLGEDRDGNAQFDPESESDPKLADTDGDGLNDLNEIIVESTDPFNPDTDGDGLSDFFEVTIRDGGNCSQSETFDPIESEGDHAVLDYDNDGLPNVIEFNGGTEPCQADTDGDGLCDGSVLVSDCVGTEVGAKTQPTNPDSDGDGLSDGVEMTDDGNCLDPNKSDTDGDGWKDGEEKNIYGTHPCLPDTDGDGLEDRSELTGLGADDLPLCLFGQASITDPLKADTDGDCLCDGPLVPAQCDGTSCDDGCCIGPELNNDDGCWLEREEGNPLKADTDGDGLCDGPLGAVDANDLKDCLGGEDLDGDGNKSETETSPILSDSDGDGLADGCVTSISPCEDKNRNGAVDPGETDPLKSDTDGGGASDGAEFNGFSDNKGLVFPVEGIGQTDPLDPCDDRPLDKRSEDGFWDKDQDGVPDHVELSLGLNREHPDSDGDGLGDATELTFTRPASLNPGPGEERCFAFVSLNTDMLDEIDALDLDSDNDGVLDSEEWFGCNPEERFILMEDVTLLGGTEKVSVCVKNTDVNADGIFDQCHLSDFDEDGIADVRDLDSDNGDFPDGDEKRFQTNRCDPSDDGRGRLEVNGKIGGGSCASIGGGYSLWAMVLLCLMGFMRRRKNEFR
ncbi:MAG: hypothetical protein VYA34_09165 [Myxococcota bacterium]|nr:hypothetical protein [Myxococcota bacterium]